MQANLLDLIWSKLQNHINHQAYAPIKLDLEIISFHLLKFGPNIVRKLFDNKSQQRDGDKIILRNFSIENYVSLKDEKSTSINKKKRQKLQSRSMPLSENIRGEEK